MALSAHGQAALGYAQLGWHLFPVWQAVNGACACKKRASCTAAGKHPLAPCCPKGVTDATADPATLTRWWTRFPAASLGVAAGPSGLVILDVDLGKGGPASLAALEAIHGRLPPTTHARTGGGGDHHLFAAPPGVALGPSVDKLGSGLDVRAGNSYVVLPPSTHRNGARYAWLLSPAQVPPQPLPAWLQALLVTPVVSSSVPASASASPLTAAGRLTDGRKRDLISAAGAIRRTVASVEELTAALTEYTRNRHEPPLPPTLVASTAKSAFRYNASDPPEPSLVSAALPSDGRPVAPLPFVVDPALSEADLASALSAWLQAAYPQGLTGAGERLALKTTLVAAFAAAGKKKGAATLVASSLKDLRGAQPPVSASPLLRPGFERLNREYFVLRETPCVVRETDMSQLSHHVFTKVAAADLTATVLGPTGLPKRVSVAAEWVQWPGRRVVDRLTYLPGQPRLAPDGSYANLWTGWGVAPASGDVTPWLELMDHLFRNEEPGERRWFTQWLAYPLQHPGTKLFTAAVFFGRTHGTGKSLLGVTMGRLYGRQNFSLIGAKHLRGSFNGWAAGKQFILVDDVTGSDKYQDADALKQLITETEVRINVKYVADYAVPDTMNFMFTSQRGDVMLLEDTDRRFYTHEAPAQTLPDSFYKRYDAWYKSDAGAAALFDYLLSYDLTGFNPNAKAYLNAAKERMIVTSRSDISAWVHDTLETPDVKLKRGEVILTQDLFTSAELLALYVADAERQAGGFTRASSVTANGVSKALSAAGVNQLLGGKPLRLPDGSQGRYFALRHRERWEAASAAELVRHLIEANPLLASPREPKY